MSVLISAQKTIAGDNGFTRTVRDWARLISANHDTAYVYYFSRPVPVFRLYMPSMPDLSGDGGARSLGAYRSGELAYVFDNLNTVGIGWESDDHLLSATIADYWFNFARSGNPNAWVFPNGLLTIQQMMRCRCLMRRCETLYILAAPKWTG